MARPKKVKEAPVVANDFEDSSEVKFTAELEITSKFTYDISHAKLLAGLPKNEGYVYYGHVFNDTATQGNHPFEDGHYIHTSLVTREFEVDGVRYIKTLNSTYKVRSNASPSDAG